MPALKRAEAAVPPQTGRRSGSNYRFAQPLQSATK
jgi:hypothetical protein